MNLLPMSYYIAVVQNQSISRAAEDLFITQQTLSAHIAAMEKELGCRLFERRPRFRLTRAGEVFYQYCLRFRELNDAMTREFQDLALPDSGVLNVGVSQTRSRILMPGIIACFRQTHPRVQVRLSEQTNEILLDKLTRGELDIIIGDVPEPLPKICSFDLYRETMVLALAGRLLSEREQELLRAENDLRLLAELPFIMNTQNDIAGKYAAVILEKAGLAPRVTVMSDSAETCLQMCSDGLGVYLCPDIYARFFAELLEDMFILPQSVSYPVQAAYRDELYVKSGVLAFAECCKAWCGSK